MISWCDFDTDDSELVHHRPVTEVARNLARGVVTWIGGLACRGR